MATQFTNPCIAEIRAGRLYWARIRTVIKHLQFLGYNITFLEGEGILTKSFLIKGEPTAINQLEEVFENVIN